MELYTCLCCGYKTMDQEPPGTFSICPKCLWEDDDAMTRNPDLWGGANSVSMRRAQHNVIEFGVSEEGIENTRENMPEEYEKDLTWKPIWETKKSTSSSISIEGEIFCKKRNKKIDIERFSSQFENMLKQNGWMFGGEFEQVEK